MVNFPAILIANGTALLLLFIVLLNRKKTIHYASADDKLFSAMVYLTMCNAIVETLSFFIDGVSGASIRALSMLLNSTTFTLNILIAFIWTLYVDYKYHEDVSRLKRIYKYVAIPAVLVITGLVVNLFTPLFFTVTANNVYERRALFVVPFIISYAYLILGALVSGLSKRKAGVMKKYLFMPVVIFLLPVFIGSFLQFIHYGVSLIWLGTAIGLASLYINIQNQTTYIDSLSGVFNRQYLDHYLSSWALKGKSEDKVAGCMLDIDGFKSINDTFGHLAGDKTICDVGKALRAAIGQDGFVSRYGGDEFVIIRHFKPSDNSDNYSKVFNDLLNNLTVESDARFDIHFSYGYDMFEEYDTYDTFINRIDGKMYANKQFFHARQKERVEKKKSEQQSSTEQRV